MFLSIIIPHYNLQHEVLARCIDSVIALNLPADSYEVIVVDDGSHTPPTWIEEQYPTNIRLIAVPHQGPGAARNRGIEEAQGRYIQFVDADDSLLPNNHMVQCIEKLHEEGPQILRFNYHVKRKEKSRIPQYNSHLKFSNTISGAEYMRQNNLSGSPCCYFFKRELAIKKDIRFPSGIFHEDEVFNTILHYHAQSLVVSNAVPYCYIIRKDSTTANTADDFKEKRMENFMEAIKQISEFKKNNYNNANTIQRQGIDRKLNMLAVDAIINMLHHGMRTAEAVELCNAKLTPLGLYPIKPANYSTKYRVFRKLANCRLGLSLLRLIFTPKRPLKK